VSAISRDRRSGRTWKKMEAPPHETKRQTNSNHGKKFDVKTFPNFASWAADHGFDAVEHRARHEIFYLALPCEQDSPRILKIIRKYLKPKQPIFVSVIAPIDPRIETTEELRDHVLEASGYKLVERLGTTDDRSFAPFSDDTSTGFDPAWPR
jgi:hypothetical protein